jgi:hypothetical protein
MSKDYNVQILKCTTYLDAKNKSISWKLILTLTRSSVTPQLFISNPPDDDLLRSKHVVAEHNHNELLLTILCVLFHCSLDGLYIA